MSEADRPRLKAMPPRETDNLVAQFAHARELKEQASAQDPLEDEVAEADRQLAITRGTRAETILAAIERQIGSQCTPPLCTDSVLLQRNMS